MGIPNMVRLKRITICVNIVNRKRYTICNGIFRKFTWWCVASLTLMNFVTPALRTFLSRLPQMARVVYDGGGS